MVLVLWPKLNGPCYGPEWFAFTRWLAATQFFSDLYCFHRNSGTILLSLYSTYLGAILLVMTTSWAPPALSLVCCFFVLCFVLWCVGLGCVMFCFVLFVSCVRARCPITTLTFSFLFWRRFGLRRELSRTLARWGKTIAGRTALLPVLAVLHDFHCVVVCYCAIVYGTLVLLSISTPYNCLLVHGIYCTIVYYIVRKSTPIVPLWFVHSYTYGFRNIVWLIAMKRKP